LTLRNGLVQLAPLPGAVTFLRRSDDYGSGIGADGWQLLLEEVAERKMERPRLVVSDGNAGLAAALDRLWSGVARQGCTVHNLRNLLVKAREGLLTAKKAQEAFVLNWRSSVRVWRLHSKAAAAQKKSYMTSQANVVLFTFPQVPGTPPPHLVFDIELKEEPRVSCR
jgi:hypothetical protein